MAFLIGVVIGVLSSIPPSGPVSVLVLRHVLMGHGDRARLVGWGRVLPESVACLLGALGITAAEVYAPWLSTTLSWIGAGILVVLSVLFLTGRADPNANDGDEEKPPTGKDFVTGLTLSGLNPTLLVTWPVVVSMLANAEVIKPFEEGWMLSIGVGVGIFASYLAIGALAPVAKTRLSPDAVRGLIRAMGALLLCLVGLFFWKMF